MRIIEIKRAIGIACNCQPAASRCKRAREQAQRRHNGRAKADHGVRRTATASDATRPTEGAVLPPPLVVERLVARPAPGEERVRR